MDVAPKHRGVKIGLSICCLLFGLVALALGIAVSCFAARCSF